jgi:uncharacterized protein YukE
MMAKEQLNKYLESMRKANKKYRENNREKFSEYQKQYYQNHKNDENYVKMLREKALKSYYKRKNEKSTNVINDNAESI